MKVLVLTTGTYPLPYEGWVEDLAAQGVFVKTADVGRVPLLQPVLLARMLRKGDYEVVLCLTDKHLAMAQQAIQLSGKEVKTSVLPELPTVAVNNKNERSVDMRWQDATATNRIDNITYLLANIADARPAVEGFAATAPDEARLRVIGTGKARAVMPVVQLARKLEVDNRIDWLGDDYNLEKEGGCSAFVASDRRLTPIEASLCAHEVPCVNPSDFTKKVERTDWCTCEFHVKQTVNHLLALRQQ